MKVNLILIGVVLLVLLILAGQLFIIYVNLDAAAPARSGNVTASFCDFGQVSFGRPSVGHITRIYGEMA